MARSSNGRCFIEFERFLSLRWKHCSLCNIELIHSNLHQHWATMPFQKLPPACCNEFKFLNIFLSNLYFQKVKCFDYQACKQIFNTNRALETAVLRRFGQKMNWRAFSSPDVLTAEKMMIIFSSPWNSSTVPTRTFLSRFFSMPKPGHNTAVHDIKSLFTIGY